MPTPMAPPADKWNVVIKLKHGNTIRRIVGLFADHNTSKLRAKIVRLFNFKPDADFYLTYTEKDGKVVVLEKDIQLHDAVVRQRLNPLRLNVTLRTTTVKTTVAINGQLQENDMSTLRAKIVNLCNLSRDTDFFLTYTDEDGEVVMLEDNEELRDVIAQHLHPFKMTVMVRNGAKSKASSFTAKLGTGFHGMPSFSEGTRTSRWDCPMNTLIAYTNCVDCPRKKANGKPVAASGSTSYQYPELDFQKFSMPFRPSPFQGNSNLPPHLNIPSSGDRLCRQFIPSPMDQLGRRYFGSSSSSSSYGQFPGNFLSPMDQLRQGAHDPVPFNHPEMSFMPPMFRSCKVNLPWAPNAGAPWVPNAGDPCYTCGMFPIIGPIVKKANGGFSCSSCTSRVGNGSHHTRIIEPDNNLSSSVVTDASAADGAAVAPSAFFFKIWRMRNVGTASWPSGTRLVYIDGYELAYRRTEDLLIPAGLPVGEEIDIGVEFIAPTTPGEFISHWKLEAPTGQRFGEIVRVFIHVKCSEKGTSSVIQQRFFQTGEKCVPAEATVTSAEAPAAVAPPSVRSVDDAPPSALSVDNARMSVPSSDDTHSSAPSVNNAPTSVPPPVDDAPTSVLFTDDAPPSVPMVEDSAPSVSVDDAPRPVSFADGGNEMEGSDNDWDLLRDELEEMEIS